MSATGATTSSGSGGAATVGSSTTGEGGGFTGPTTTTGAGGGFQDCGDGEECPDGTLCKYEKCIPDLGPCETNNDCPGDSYCDEDLICVPYGVPEDKVNDPSCVKIPDLDITPVVHCEWPDPLNPPDDDASAYVNVYSAPAVADLNLDLDPDQLRPSVVVTTWTVIDGERIGMLRVFDGRTCEEQLRLGGPGDPDAAANRPSYGSQWAIGDLDGDVGTPNGHPEIIGLHRVDAPFGNPIPEVAVIAYEIDSTVTPPVLRRRWYGRECGVAGPTGTMVTFGSAMAENGPGLWDLDDDGVPEIVVDRAVFDHDGCLLNPPVVYDPYLTQTNNRSKGVISTVADVDHDGMPDLVRYDGIYGWDPITTTWQIKPWFVPDAAAHKKGHVAVVDLGHYSALPGMPATDPLPEIVVVSAASEAFSPSTTGSIRVQTLTGEVVIGPIDLYHLEQDHGGHGGPPTASDFDGDGWPEIAAAANEFYTVYDPDCVEGGDPARPGGMCTRPPASTLPDLILWASPSRDFSSSITGSSIFDFDGDGAAEAVYHDECYLRVYDGATGEVIFSAPRPSGTGSELPVIADVTGNFATEIVASRAANSSNCPSPDPLYPGSGTFVQVGGIVVYRDPENLWASSRPIWNQHAYSVTHVNDDATIPASSAMLRNWEVEGLNNFRQNVQGDNALAIADLTVELSSLEDLCAGASGELTLSARVCNRGTAPVTDGALVAFYAAPSGQPLTESNGVFLCQDSTPTLLDVGTCTIVSCTGDVPPGFDVWVVVDPEGEIAECHGGNNVGASALAICPSVN